MTGHTPNPDCPLCEGDGIDGAGQPCACPDRYRSVTTIEPRPAAETLAGTLDLGGDPYGDIHPPGDDDAPGAREVLGPGWRQEIPRPVDEPQRGPLLEFVPLADLAKRVDATEVTYLLRGCWPDGDYGVVHGEEKAHKSWAALDMAVAVASGTPWLGAVEVDRAGPVIVFWGEGGERGVVRRLRGLAADHGVGIDDLPIIVCPRAPHLNDDAVIAEMAAKVAEVEPALIVIDPLYLAAPTAELGNLYGMGGLLERPQRVAQDHGANLLVVHHDNRSGRSGARALSGAGPAEWARVIASAKVVSRTTEGAKSTTRSTLTFIGGEIPDQAIRVDRTIWADDPDDLKSRLNVVTRAVVGNPGGLQASPTKNDDDVYMERVSDYLRSLDDRTWRGSKRDLRKEVTGATQRVSDAIDRLVELGYVDASQGDNGTPSYRLVGTFTPADDAHQLTAETPV